MRIPNDIARCDGLLPKNTDINGALVRLWSIDCPHRNTCARYLAAETDDPAAAFALWHIATHAPNEPCPVRIQVLDTDSA